MGTKSKAEACGRCSMTTVMDVTSGESGHNPYEGDRIEVSEEELRRVSPHVVALSNLKDRLTRWGRRLTYGR